MQTLLLIDGSSYLYRAFHALPDLRNANNEPTGAIYGVLNMLRRLHKDYQPDYSACVFDAKGKTFRDDWYPQYKATRSPMSPDLACQIEPLLEAIRAMGWPLIVMDNVEADDVIGTLARMAREQGVRTVISTGDKDMAQLVCAEVSLINTMSNEALDEQGVLNKFGIPPQLMIDYLTLIGDAIDNVPGVDKVGPKTAVKWLTQYHTLDNIVAHAQEISGAVGENLRASLDWLPQAKRLLTIRQDLQLPVTLTDLPLRQPDVPVLKQLFERFGFKTWRRELDALPAPAEAPHEELPSKQYEIVASEAQLERWLQAVRNAPWFCFHLATTSEDPLNADIAGIALGLPTGEACYVPVGHLSCEQLPQEIVLAALAPLFNDPDLAKLGHDLKFQKHVLSNYDIGLRGIAHDVLLQSYVLESHRAHDIVGIATRHLDRNLSPLSSLTGKGAKQISVTALAIGPCATHFGDATCALVDAFPMLEKKINDVAGLAYTYQQIEMPLTSVLYQIERNGVLIDAPLLNAQSKELGGRMAQLEVQAYELAGQEFNLGSPKQIQEILFQKLKLPVKKKTPGGTPSTDEAVLQELALDYPLPKILLEHRLLAKLKSTYTDKLPRMINAKTGRVHTWYAQATAVTGRLSSTEPNLQNIPARSAEGRKIREAFIAPPGSVIVAADYSQIELRIMAHLSEDAGLVAAFTEGEDIHRATAAEIFGIARGEVTSEQRRYAKVINFGLIYGMSAFGLATQLGVDRNAAQAYMARYFARYPGVAEYMQRTRETARKTGFVETIYGRRLWLPEINSANGLRRQAAERAAINAPMQGSAADLIKLAMIAVQGWLDEAQLGTRLIMQVHDELVLEVPETELEEVRATLPRLMCAASKLSLPVTVDLGVGLNWERAH